MASGESSIVVQNSEVLEKLAEREKELAGVEELVRSLDEEVKRERETAKESKKQVGAVRHSLSHGGTEGGSSGLPFLYDMDLFVLFTFNIFKLF